MRNSIISDLHRNGYVYVSKVEKLYNKTCELYENIHKRVVGTLTVSVEEMPMSKRYKVLCTIS